MRKLLWLACVAVAAKGTHSHVDTAYTERGDAGSALHRRLQTCDPSSWPDLDWYVCGACKALVNWNAYGSTCGGYCSGIGLTCLDGWEEEDENCIVAEHLGCDGSVSSSDAICECAPAETPSPTATPAPTLMPVQKSSFVSLSCLSRRPLHAGSEKPGACGDSGPADGAETPPSSPGDGDSSDGAAHAAATSVLVGLVAAFAV